MLTDTEGIVLRQVKTSYNRKMIRLFTRSYGKISAGTGIGERGRSKSALAIRPFTYGRYELFKSRDSYNIDSAEVIKSFYGIGEDVDKYMQGAYVLEFTEKALPEEMPAPAIFDLLIEILQGTGEQGQGDGDPGAGLSDQASEAQRQHAGPGFLRSAAEGKKAVVISAWKRAAWSARTA